MKDIGNTICPGHRTSSICTSQIIKNNLRSRRKKADNAIHVNARIIKLKKQQILKMGVLFFS
jgi:hypothetical protein